MTYKDCFRANNDYNPYSTADMRPMATNTKFTSTFIPSDAFMQLTVAVPLQAVGEGPELGMGVGLTLG